MKEMDASYGLKTKMLKRLLSSKKEVLTISYTHFDKDKITLECKKENLLNTLFNYELLEKINDNDALVYINNEKWTLVISKQVLSNIMESGRLDKIKNKLSGNEEEIEEAEEAEKIQNRYLATGFIDEVKIIKDIDYTPVQSNRQKDAVLWLNEKIKISYINRSREYLRVCINYNPDQPFDKSTWFTVEELLKKGTLK